MSILKKGTPCLLIHSGFPENVGKTCEVMEHLGAGPLRTLAGALVPQDVYRVQFREPVKCLDGYTGNRCMSATPKVARNCLLPLLDPDIDTTEQESERNPASKSTT